MISRLRLFHGKRRAVIAALVVCLTVAVVQRESLLAGAGRWLSVSRPLTGSVDYVMVLGGEANTRPFVAAEMVNAGRARQVLVAEFESSSDVLSGVLPAEHEIIREVLLRSGVPAEAIMPLGGIVASTEDEARCLARFLEANPDASVAVVTSDFHTRRTRLIFSRTCGEMCAKVQFVGAPTDGFESSNWWKFETGLHWYVAEYLKLFVAFLAM